MSTAIVTQYKSSAPGEAGMRLPALVEPYLASEAVTFTTSTQSTVFNEETRFVRIAAVDGLHYAVGTNPTADTADPLIPAGGSLVFAVEAGQSMRVALIDD